MPEPPRELVLRQIVTKLQGMTGVRYWGGSYLNAPVVERRWADIERVGSLPHLIVTEASGSRLDLVETGGAGLARFTHAFRVLIRGYVSADATDGRSTWLERLWGDVARTLLANQTLGGEARELALEGEYETDEGEWEPLGAFAQVVTVSVEEDLTVA